MVNLLPIHHPDTGATVLVNQAEIPRGVVLRRSDDDAYTLAGESEQIRALLCGRDDLPAETARVPAEQ